MRFSMIDRIIYRLTARRWNKFISLILCRHYGMDEWKARLSSEQLHKLAAEFDPTQKARWLSIRGDGRLIFREDVHADVRPSANSHECLRV